MTSPEHRPQPAISHGFVRTSQADATTAEPSPPPDRPDIGHGWRLLFVFVVAEVAFLVVSALVLLPFVHRSPGLLEDGPLPPVPLVVALSVPPVLAAVVVLIGVLLVGRGGLGARLRSELALRWHLPDLGVGLALGALGLLITVPASLLWAYLVGEERANSAVGEVFDGQRLPLGIALAIFFMVWLVAPFCEELLYRGVLWRAMEFWGWNRWVILVLTTVAFSVAHLELLRTPLLVVISVPIALARLFTGNLASSVVAHQMNNLLPAIGLLLVSQGLLPG